MTASDNTPDLAKVEVDELAAISDAEPTKAEILADLRQALKEALAGDLRPALEVLDEIDREIKDNDDNGNSATHLSETIEIAQKEVSGGEQVDGAVGVERGAAGYAGGVWVCKVLLIDRFCFSQWNAVEYDLSATFRAQG